MPSPEHDAFASYINSLDSSDFSHFKGKPNEDTETSLQKDGVQLIESDDENKEFTYGVDISLANFRTKIDTDLGNASLSLAFPSDVKYLALDEIHDALARMMEVSLPLRQYTPHVRITKGLERQVFDLGNYWQGKRYEVALKEQPLSVVYFLPGTSSPDAPKPSQTDNPYFRYGFMRKNEEDYIEHIEISHDRGSSMDAPFFQELLKRNRGYNGHDLEADSLNFQNKIHELCKKHPKQTLGF